MHCVLKQNNWELSLRHGIRPDFLEIHLLLGSVLLHIMYYMYCSDFWWIILLFIFITTLRAARNPDFFLFTVCSALPFLLYILYCTVNFYYFTALPVMRTVLKNQAFNIYKYWSYNRNLVCMPKSTIKIWKVHFYLELLSIFKRRSLCNLPIMKLQIWIFTHKKILTYLHISSRNKPCLFIVTDFSSKTLCLVNNSEYVVSELIVGSSEPDISHIEMTHLFELVWFLCFLKNL